MEGGEKLLDDCSRVHRDRVLKKEEEEKRQTTIRKEGRKYCI